VAAGWAIDLFLGKERRPHDDIEIAVPRERFGELAPALAAHELFVLRHEDGRALLHPYERALEAGTHQTWVRDRGQWRLDVFREPHDGDTWICRRDERIRLPYSELIERTPDGIPFARPEVVLLFKAKAAREKDEDDLAAVLPQLGPERRRRLSAWLELVHPSHRWLQFLR
jgi:hypothetical protein